MWQAREKYCRPKAPRKSEMAMKLSPEEIVQQQELLRTNRQRLNARLGQLARYGRSDSPPNVITDIDEARYNIARIKKLLRDNQVIVADHPDDDAPPLALDALAAAAPLETMPPESLTVSSPLPAAPGMVGDDKIGTLNHFAPPLPAPDPLS